MKAFFYYASHTLWNQLRKLMKTYVIVILICAAIGFAGGLALIQHFKRQYALYIGRCWFWNYPRRIKILNRFQTWHYGRFQTRRSKDDEIVGEGRVLWFIHSKI